MPASQSEKTALPSSTEKTDSLTAVEKTDETETTPSGSLEKVEGGIINNVDIIIAAWVMQFVTSGYVNAFGVYQDFYTREFITNESTSTISWIGSTNNLLVFGGGLIFGRIFDAGYFRSMLAGGSLLFIFCLFMISLTQPNHWYQNFLAQGIGLGAAQGLLYLPSLAVIGQHFEKKRTFVMGIVASGAAVGGIIHPIMLNQLFNGSVGFHNGVRTSAAMNGFLLIVANVLMIRRGVEQEVNHDTPATDPPAKKWYQFFLDPDYGTAVAGNFLFFLGGYFPLFYLQLSAVTHGIDPTLAFYSISIMNAANLPGRLLPNRFASRLGVHNQMIVSAAVCGAFCFLFLVMKNVASLVLIAIIYGFASGAYVSLLAPMLSGLADSVNEIGTRMGTCFAIGGVATFVGPPIMGALLTSKYIWLRPSVFSGACVGAGVLLMIIARHFKIRKLSLRGTPLKRKFVV